MTGIEAAQRRHRWWRYEAWDKEPIPCEEGDFGAFPVRWVDLGPPIGVQAMDDRYDEQGLLRPEYADPPRVVN